MIWGALMAVALAAAGATAWTAPDFSGERLVAANDGHELQKSVRQLAAQRDDLANRLARLERGVGDLKMAEAARAAGENDVTGSITREPPKQPQPQPEPKPFAFGVNLGPDSTTDAVRRRWAALTARYPQILGKLTARSAKRDGVFELVAGPFATRSDANRACTALADQGFACDTTDFVGDPLTRP